MQKLSYFIILSLSVYNTGLCQWTHVSLSDKNVSALYVKEDILFSGIMNQIYRSSDNGVSWDTVATLSTFEVSAFNQVENTLFATTSWLSIWPIPRACIFRSLDCGATWDSVFAGPNGATSIQSIDSNIFTNVGGDLYHSPDNGNSWIRIDTTSIFTDFVQCIATSENNLYISMASGGLYRSTNLGKTWYSIGEGLPDTYYSVIAQNSMIFVLGRGGQVYRSDNYGQNWSYANTGLPDTAWVINLALIEDYLLATVKEEHHLRVYKMNLLDLIWDNFSAGLGLSVSGWINTYANNSEYIFAGSDSGLWRRPLSQIVSVGDNDQENLPTGYYLEQNYPNPFNPVTTIAYLLPKSSFVNLSVYDVLGRLVETLVNQKVQSGYHSIVWDASKYKSGVYIYRIKTIVFSERKKCLLLK